MIMLKLLNSHSVVFSITWGKVLEIPFFRKTLAVAALNYATGLRNHNMQEFLWKQKEVEFYAVSKNVQKLVM